MTFLIGKAFTGRKQKLHVHFSFVNAKNCRKLAKILARCAIIALPDVDSRISLRNLALHQSSCGAPQLISISRQSKRRFTRT